MKKLVLLGVMCAVVWCVGGCGDDKKGGTDDDTETSTESTDTSDTDSAESPAPVARTETLFNDDWKFYLGYSEDAIDPDFDDSEWDTVNLPHDWSIYFSFNPYSPVWSSGGYLDGGMGWYRKNFVVEETDNRKFYLRFEGVYMNSDVWINGELVGNRPNGYIWFEYDITPYLNATGEQNTITVRADNSLQPNSRWYSGSGIYRNVWLVQTHTVHMKYDGISVQTPTVTPAAAVIQTSVETLNTQDEVQQVSLNVAIENAAGKVVVEGFGSAVEVPAAGEETLTLALQVPEPAIWSIDEPNMYTAHVTLMDGDVVLDERREPFGIRTFRFDVATGFYLNGENVKLNGVCLHHDLGALGSAANPRAVERRLEIMKAMGTNAIRTSHNPMEPFFLDLCDRMGILVIEEAFDAWRLSKITYDYSIYFDDWAETDLKDMVRRDRNHPSIIMWSIGNEIYDTMSGAGDPAGTGYFAEGTEMLRDWAKEIDDTRPITTGSNYALWANRSSSNLDVVGINYNTAPDYDFYNVIPEQHPDWILYASETCSAVRSRGVYYTPTDQNFIATESDLMNHQMSSYDNSVPYYGESAENSWRLVNTRNYIAGEFVWTGFDYIGEPTPYGWNGIEGWPAKSSYFGIVDTAGFPKDVYYFYQSKWTDEPMVHLLPHWNWAEGDTIEVWAYTNTESAELFLNDVSQGELVYPTDPEAHQRLVWQVPFEAGTIRVEARNGGELVAEDAITTAGDAAKVNMIADRETISADGIDMVFVETRILDAADVFVPTADNLVTYEVSGPGVIVGVDNGDAAASDEAYKDNKRTAFNGLCLVIVQSTGEAGDITVAATAEGLESTSITVAAQ